MNDLRTFLADLDKRLLRLSDPVDPINQAGILSSEARGPYLLEQLKGFPDWQFTDVLVSNRDDQAVALGTTPDRVVQHLSERLFDANEGRIPMNIKMVDDGPCKEVIKLGDEADIREIPIPIHSEGDGGEIGGRYLGSGLTITKDPDTGVQNESIIRTHIRDHEPRRVGFWMAARHNWAHYKKYEERGEKMPMAYVVGCHPVYDIIANYSGPHDGHDEFAIGAGILGEELEMVKCETVDLEVPANCELVVEGFVPPGLREPEGPFGEFTGFQGGKTGEAPVFEITAITHRRKPIFRHMQATVFTDHQALVALPMEAAIYRQLLGVQGGAQGGLFIHDVHVPIWAALFTIIVKMTPRWDGQGQAVALAALNSVNLHPKIAIVVDEDVDIYNAEEVIWAMTQRMNPENDILVLPNQRIHPLDQSVPQLFDDTSVMRYGGKLVIDATKPPTSRPADREEFRRVRPQGAGDATLEAVINQIRAFPNHSGIARQASPDL